MSKPSTDSSATKRLLEDCREDDRESFERLFGRYRTRLKALITRRLDQALASRLDASDVVQETQTVMYARFPDYLKRRPMPFRTWAIKTALDCLGKARRTHILTDKRSVLHEVSLSEASSACLAERLVSSNQSLSEQLERKETIALVRRALAALGNVDRDILLMRHVDGLDNREIGGILGLSTDAVSKRHGRALIRLHECLKRMG
jgi:RNA polymerase sigma-70 factor (ECF subfamily)